MPQTSHIEQHFTGSALVRDTVIGMSDGLTVPFALAAGLSGAVSATGIILTTGLAEIAAGSIAMGRGFIPLSLYFFAPTVGTALIVSVIGTLIALTVFGYIKGHFTGVLPVRSALQTVLIGGLAASAAFLIGRAIS